MIDARIAARQYYVTICVRIHAHDDAEAAEIAAELARATSHDFAVDAFPTVGVEAIPAAVGT